MANHRLQIYIATHCVGCIEAAHLAEDMSKLFPTLNVELIRVDKPGVVTPPEIFATPTYIWDGRVYSLGNPTREALVAMIAAQFQNDGTP